MNKSPQLSPKMEWWIVAAHYIRWYPCPSNVERQRTRTRHAGPTGKHPRQQYSASLGRAACVQSRFDYPAQQKDSCRAELPPDFKYKAFVPELIRPVPLSGVGSTNVSLPSDDSSGGQTTPRQPPRSRYFGLCLTYQRMFTRWRHHGHNKSTIAEIFFKKTSFKRSRRMLYVHSRRPSCRST